MSPPPLEEAIDRYLETRADELSDSSIRTHYDRLNLLVQWAQDERHPVVDDVAELDAEAVLDYRIARNEAGKAPSTIEGEIRTIKLACGIWAALDWVDRDLPERVDDLIPSVSKSEGTSRESMAADRVEAMLDYLDRFDYASRPHVVLALIWQTGMRRSAVRSLDLRDVDLDGAALRLRHRPETGTILKNGNNAERDVAIGETMADRLGEYGRNLVPLLEDYITERRIETEDAHGRRPLLTTNHGRIGATSISGICYRLTRPCAYGEPCPHDRDLDTCEAREHGQESHCPDSYSAHPIRGAAIEMHRQAGLPLDFVSARVNADPDVIKQHYDHRGPAERLDARRNRLEGSS
jgi:integrase